LHKAVKLDKKSFVIIGIAVAIVIGCIGYYLMLRNEVTAPGDVVHSFNAPGTDARGLAWDGTHLWNADGDADKIYRIDPTSGAVVDEIDMPSDWSVGLTWDGTHLWCADSDAENVYKLDPATGVVISLFTDISLGDLAWDNTHLWGIDATSGPGIYRTCQKLDPTTGNVVHSISLPGPCVGLAWDGAHLWTADLWEEKIYKLDPETGNVILHIKAPSPDIRGLTWNGTYLWAADITTLKIYRIDVTDA
jgi:DNA-binding beta-propeller fold protein YncE